MYAHLLCAGWGYRKSSLAPPCCAHRDMTGELGPGKALFLWGQRGWQMLFFKLRRPGQALKQPEVLSKDAAVVRVGNDTHLGAADGEWPCVSLRKHACLALPMKCQLQHGKARKNADPVMNDYTCKCMSCEDDFPWRHKAWAINACRSSRERVSTWTKM